MAMNKSRAVLDEQALGKRLQVARQRAGLTQQTLCHRANLSYSTLAKIERGAIKSPSIFTVMAIAGALGTTLDELVGQASGALNRRELHKTKSGVSFIYFDVNGCLVRFYQRAFSHIAEDIAIPADVVETAFWHYNDDVCRGILTMDDFNQAFAKRLGIPAIDWKHYYLAAAEPVLEMHQLVEWAAGQYKVGLLTNIMPGLLSAMRESGQLPEGPYDVVVDSSEVGVLKPEEQIYKIATEQAGAPTEEILLIDDTRGNLSAAEKFGWHVLWFDYARPEESVAHIREALEPAL
jgi:FMN phosphatase YigB (HAD superfamily)/DNA-binding XRE family transcriptional regulator